MILMFAATEAQLQSRNSSVEALILEISRGDTAAIGSLYELIKTDVYAYALSKLANEFDAEDITHDTFVLIYKYAKQYKPMGKPLAWVFTIELNLIRKHCNASKGNLSLDEAIGDKSSDDDFQSSITESQFLIELLKNLTEDEREIISLHVVSGLKHWEIAKLLGKPLSTVLSKYNRAIKKLQNKVKGVDR